MMVVSPAATSRKRVTEAVRHRLPRPHLNLRTCLSLRDKQPPIISDKEGHFTFRYYGRSS